MGVRGNDRAPTLSPSWSYFWAACMLAATIGLISAAAVDAHGDQDHFWMTFFIAADIACFALYFRTVGWWVEWNTDRSGAYKNVCRKVCFPGECDNDPCQPGDPGPFEPFV